MGNTWDEREQRFEERPVRSAISGTVRIGIVAAVAILVVLVLGAVVWWFGVKTSDIKGKGDAEVVKNEAGNRIRAQEGFLDKYNAIKAADQNLTLTAEQLRKTPDSAKLQTELTGQKMICNDLVARYNAAARKFTQSEFRDADLPPEIDNTKSNADLATDCKEI